MWIYVNSEPNLWTVGHYSPEGEFNSDSDHGDREDAAKRCNYLNGGHVHVLPAVPLIRKLIAQIKRLLGLKHGSSRREDLQACIDEHKRAEDLISELEGV